MVYQITEGLDERLKKTGCYFLAILKIYQELARIELSVEDINMIFKLCVKMEYVDHEAYIKKDAIKGIAQIASGFTGKHVYMKRIVDNGKYNYLIAMFSRKTSFGKKVVHFVNVDLDEAEKVIYDPYSPQGSKTARIGHIESYRDIWAEAF